MATSPSRVLSNEPVPFDDPPTPHLATCCSSGGRNLVVSVDGTAKQFNIENTNVVGLYSRIIKDENQLAYYNSGIGTYAAPSFKSLSYALQVIDHHLDKVFAWRFEKIIYAAYEWLAENYKPGDRIFLFGFSRGAYQVRALAAMINRVGLLHKGNKHQIAFAYELYTTTPPIPEGQDSMPNSKSKDLCDQFKRTLSHSNVKVHFVGVWDTVSSIGAARNKSLPGTTSGMGHVCAFRHALALDERRVMFQPEYVNGGLGPTGKKKQNVKEVWFSGTHSDVGGHVQGDNYGPALRWMAYEAMYHGLRMLPYRGTWQSITPDPSVKTLWRVMELFPFKSLSYRDEDSTTRKPHTSSPRIVQPRQLIHESVRADMSMGKYCPAALLNWPGYSWGDLTQSLGSLVEEDPFLEASRAVSDLVKACKALIPMSSQSPIDFDPFDTATSIIFTFIDTDVRRTALTEVCGAGDALLDALRVENTRCYQYRKDMRHIGWPSILLQKLVSTLAIFESRKQAERQIKTDHLRRLMSLMDKLRGDFDYGAYGPQIQMVLRNFGNGLVEQQHVTGKVMSIGLSDDTALITTQTHYATWKLSEHTIDTLQGFMDPAMISTTNGTLVASLRPEMLCIIDAKARTVKHFVVPGTMQVSVMRASHSGYPIALGCRDGSIRIWNGAGVAEQPLNGHQQRVRALAFSKRDTYLASGSDDGTVRVWKQFLDTSGVWVEAGELVGHKNCVLSVAWSCSQNRLGSGDANGVVIVWDFAGTDARIIRSFVAHDGWIRDLAFFDADEDVLATGGSDKNVRLWACQDKQEFHSKKPQSLWDFDTGEEVSVIVFQPQIKSLEGTEAAQESRLISAGDCGSVYMWDVQFDEMAKDPTDTKVNPDVDTVPTVQPDIGHITAKSHIQYL